MIDKDKLKQLADFELPLDQEKTWAALESKMHPRRKSKRAFFWWWILLPMIAGGTMVALYQLPSIKTGMEHFNSNDEMPTQSLQNANSLEIIATTTATQQPDASSLSQIDLNNLQMPMVLDAAKQDAKQVTATIEKNSPIASASISSTKVSISEAESSAFSGNAIQNAQILPASEQVIVESDRSIHTLSTPVQENIGENQSPYSISSLAFDPESKAENLGVEYRALISEFSVLPSKGTPIFDISPSQSFNVFIRPYDAKVWESALYGGMTIGIGRKQILWEQSLPDSEPYSGKEKVMEYFGASVGAELKYEKNLFFRIGVEMLQINESFQFQQSNTSQTTQTGTNIGYILNPDGSTNPIIGDKNVQIQRNIQKQLYNEVLVWSVPISAGYRFNWNSHSIGFSMGLSPLLSLQRHGEILDRTITPRTLSDTKSSSKLAFSPMIGVLYSRQLRNGLGLEFGAEYRRMQVFQQSLRAEKFELLGIQSKIFYNF